MLLALGIVILANSRPYEGFVLTLTVARSLAVWMWRRRAVALVRVVLPAAIVLALGAAATMHYYSAVTGSPFRTPYQVDRDRYAPARIFLWERPIPIPVYPDRAVHDFYVNWELPQFLAAKALSGLLQVSFEKLLAFWLFFLGPAFTLPLIFLPQILRDRRIRPLVIVCGI